MKLSIVSPAYFEEEALPYFFERCLKVCRSLVIANIISDYEIIIIDDGSKDKTWSTIENANINDNHIRGVKFSKNFGHHIAVTAGLDYSEGDYVILMDSDLQDEPEHIPALIEKCKEGFQLVYVIRKSRNDGFIKALTSKLFYKIFNLISEINISPDVGIFRIMSKAVVENVKKVREQNRFITMITEWVGFNIGSIEVDRPGRKYGDTKYPLRRMIKLAITGITSFSTFPLKLSIYMGTIVSIFSFLLGGFFLVRKLVFGLGTLGWPSLVTTVLFLGGVQLITLGIIGEYIGKIFMEVKNRPLYIVEKKT